MKDKTRDILNSDTNLNVPEERRIINENSLIYDISNDKLALVLQELYEGIIFKENNIKLENKNNYDSVIIYLDSKKEEENFHYLGSKSINIRESNIQEHYEIFGRCYNMDGEEKTYKFIFNDVTKIKLEEEINADYKYKKIFLSKVAHEFKNPLICIIELIDQISDKLSNFNSENDLVKTASNFHKKDFILGVNEILNSIKHMSNYLLILVKDMDFFSLTFSEKNSQLKLEKEMVKLIEILSFCKNVTTTLIKKYLKEQSIKFKLEYGNLPEKIYTDETKLKQLLINLLSNSVKYTNNGSITLKVEGSQDKLRFDVRDTGKGLTESQQMRLLGKNEERGEITKHGCGLGLSVVKDILDLFESKIVYEASESQGSIFSFVIDVSNKSVQENIQENLAIPDNNENNQMTVENHSQKSNTSISTVKQEFIPSKINLNLFTNDRNVIKKVIPSNYISSETSTLPIKYNANYIMVVDDEITTRKSTIRLLNNYFKSSNETNFVIIEAADGIECLYLDYEYIRKGVNLSMIISDETMNYMNGSSCAKILSELISSKELRTVPFFILTAYKSFDLEERPFIIKSYTKPITKIVIANILNKIGIKID